MSNAPVPSDPPPPSFVTPPTPEFVPHSGPEGQMITLLGQNFNFAPVSVHFGDVAAIVVGTPSATQIVVVVPPNLIAAGGAPRGVRIKVTTAGGSVVSADTFTVVGLHPDPLPPSFVTPPIPQFMPRSGIEGQTIILNGQHFNFAPVSVDFGGVAATIVGTPTATQIAVVLPDNLTATGDGAREARIKVTTAGGSVVSDSTFCVTAPRYDVPPPSFAAPQIPEFLPKRGIEGQTIAIYGQNFDRVPVLVKFDDVDASLVGAPTATQIKVVVPDLIAAGGDPRAVKIEVTTAGGTVVSTGTFTVTRPYPDWPPPSFAAPPIPQFSPRSGVAGQSILLNGHNFRAAPVSVKFAGTDAIVVGVPTATQIVTIVPPNMIPDGSGAQGAKITVTTAGGSVVSDDVFSVIAR